MSRKRNFLFLQGVCSPFFARLADALKAQGHGVYKINFTVGDVAYWWPRKALNFRAPLDELPAFLKSAYDQYEITDQVLFGDRRYVHQPAIAAAKEVGVRSHVYEEGYFRPYWVTLERGGVNRFSQLPKDPVWYLQNGNKFEVQPAQGFVSAFIDRALHDVLYHCASFWNPIFFRHYRNHAPVNAAVQYYGYIQRLPKMSQYRKLDAHVIDTLVMSKAPFFLLPLQLNSDAQIREHSTFRDMADVMEQVVKSFAAHAQVEHKLLVKNHPLDLGLDNHRKTLHAICRRYGVEERVSYIETGDLDKILSNTCGTITVNSTLGCLALSYGSPTITLSSPIYDIKGLTYQQGLDRFWNASVPPDRELFALFQRVVTSTTQINGGFYCSHGIDMAVKNSLKNLLSEHSPLEELLGV